MNAISVPDNDARPLRTRLSEAEDKVAILEQWLNVMIEHSPIAMCIVSAFENRCVRANAALAQLYGMSLEEILSTDPFTLALRVTHPDDLLAEQNLFSERAIGARRSYQVEKRYVRPDGSIRWGLLTFSAIYAEPVENVAFRPISYVIVQAIDVTEHKALADTLVRREAELRHAQKIDGIGKLAAGIAHDFNNLQTVIMGHAELLKLRLHDVDDEAIAREMRTDLAAIAAASDRATRLTMQLLAYGRRETVQPRTIALSKVVATLQSLLSRSIESSIHFEQSLAAVGCICADTGQIGQVVMNLVLNARDAITGPGRICVATRDVTHSATPGLDRQAEWVALSVSDTGHGMSPEVQARMFEAFFTTRADRPGTQGTGLGLATVQRIVTEVSGQIEVESAPGTGTCVTIYFPRVADAAEADTTHSARPLRARAPNTQRVLVVEDDPAVRSLVATVLLGASYLVAVARDGAEALQFMQAAPQPYHLIVSDLVMPSIGGTALAERLRATGHRTRVLFISGYSDHTVAELSRYGNLLAKPFTPAQLLAAVASSLPDPD